MQPTHKRPKPRDYLLNLSQQLSKIMFEQELTIQDLEKALDVIKFIRNNNK